jgi:tetratricopeptide (TPR) repeat protein
MSRLLLLAALALLTACTSLRPPGPAAPVETREVPRSAPAGTPVERPVVGPPLPPAIAAGQLDRAAALAERALRIAPRDAQAWYKLASVQFAQKRYADAEGSAQRALSFASGNRQLTQTINALLATIRSAR